MGAAVVSVVVMGMTFPALAELSRYPMATGQAARYVVAGVTLLLIGRRRPALPARDIARVFVMGAAGLVGTNALLIAAERSTDAGTVGVIVGCLPVVVALVGPLVARRRVRYWIVVWAGVAVLGATLVEGAGGRATVQGIGDAIGALVCEVAFIVVGTPVFRRHGAMAVSLWLCASAALIWVVGGVIADGSSLFQLPSVGETEAIAYLGLVASVIGMLCWGFGMARLGSERFGLFTGVIPIAALLSSAALGLSALTLVRMVGCLVVAGSVCAGVAIRH
jgi:drug/metabolite transporter (DMT)-like permease